MTTIAAARCVDADAAVVELLRMELGGVRILSEARWHAVAALTAGDDTYFGTVVFAIDGSAARLDVALAYGAMVHIDAWLGDPAGRQSYVQTAIDPRLREVDVDRPSAR